MAGVRPGNGQPNIVLITTDQQRFDAAGAAAPDFLRTPHIDILESEGTRFTRAYSECPICVPARVTLMTGKSALEHRMMRNGRTTTVMGRDGTLPSVMRAAGYQTIAIGKMHFGPQRARHGFDEMILPDDYYREIRRSGARLQPMRHGLGQLSLYPTLSTVPESMTLTNWTVDQSVSFILNRRDPTAPFFLWCSFSKPHPPLDPPEPYYSMYADAPIPSPVSGSWAEGTDVPASFDRIRARRGMDRMDDGTLRRARMAYYGLVTQIDYNLGRLYAALQEAGLWDDTLILYTSDHGEYLGDHGTAGKIFFHDPSARVPLIVRPPLGWDIARGTEVSKPVTLADVMPSLSAFAVHGADAVHPDASGQSSDSPGEGITGCSGHNLLPWLARPPEGTGYATGVGAYETPCDYVAITDGHWKYIYYPEGAMEQLFNLDEDPDETTNRIRNTEVTDAATRLRTELVRIHRRHDSGMLEGDWFPVRDVEQRAARRLYSFHTEYFDGDVRH